LRKRNCRSFSQKGKGANFQYLLLTKLFLSRQRRQNMPDIDNDNWDGEESKSTYDHNIKKCEGNDLDWNDWDEEEQDAPELSSDPTPSKSKSRAAELQAKRRSKQQGKAQKGTPSRHEASEGKQSEDNEAAGYKGSPNENPSRPGHDQGHRSEGKEPEDNAIKKSDLLQYFADDDDEDDDLDAIGGKRAVSPVTVMSMNKQRNDLSMMDSLMQQKEKKSKLEQKIEEKTRQDDCAIETLSPGGEDMAFTKRSGLREQLERIEKDEHGDKITEMRQTKAASPGQVVSKKQDDEDDDIRDKPRDLNAAKFEGRNDDRDRDRRDYRRGSSRERRDNYGSRRDYDRRDSYDDRYDDRDRRTDRRDDDNARNSRDYDRRDRDYGRRDDRRDSARNNYDRKDSDRDYDRRDGEYDRRYDDRDSYRRERGNSRERDSVRYSPGRRGPRGRSPSRQSPGRSPRCDSRERDLNTRRDSSRSMRDDNSDNDSNIGVGW
jgi:hypothetical protein